VSDNQFSRFLLGMVRVVVDRRQGVKEYGERFEERDGVLAKVGCRFRWIPLEDEFLPPGRNATIRFQSGLTTGR
jgi:hypothetical protein